MTNEEILKIAVEKAFNLGWRFDCRKDISLSDFCRILFDRYEGCSPEEYLFSHDFAKALWGEDVADFQLAVKYNDKYFDAGSMILRQPKWQHHLQTMVLKEDPIKYLEQFLNNK